MGGQPITSDLENASEKPESIEMKMQIESINKPTKDITEKRKMLINPARSMIMKASRPIFANVVRETAVVPPQVQSPRSFVSTSEVSFKKSTP